MWCYVTIIQTSNGKGREGTRSGLGQADILVGAYTSDFLFFFFSSNFILFFFFQFHFISFQFHTDPKTGILYMHACVRCTSQVHGSTQHFHFKRETPKETEKKKSPPPGLVNSAIRRGRIAHGCCLRAANKRGCIFRAAAGRSGKGRGPRQ